jgi:pyruvate, water dikinase
VGQHDGGAGARGRDHRGVRAIGIGTTVPIVRFEDLPAEASRLAGGKGANLARMAAAGLPVPRGFVVCAAAFQSFLERLDGHRFVHQLIDGLDVHDRAALDTVSTSLHELIVSSPLPDDLSAAIGQAYEALSRRAVAVRSSAISEDGAAASFAGQQETVLNVCGEEAIARAVRTCWASFFAPRAIFYRAQKGSLADTEMAVVVQEMVLADKSGVLFTVDPIRKRRDRLVVEAVFGLGEGVVSGEITPDHYVLDRADGALVDVFVSVQSIAVVHDAEHGGTRHVALAEDVGGARVLDQGELAELHAMGLGVEAVFGSPQDVEWCYRGDELLVLQSRPVTTL